MGAGLACSLRGLGFLKLARLRKVRRGLGKEEEITHFHATDTTEDVTDCTGAGIPNHSRGTGDSIQDEA